MAVPWPHLTAEGSLPSSDETMEDQHFSRLPIFQSLSDIFNNIVPLNDASFDFYDWPELLKRADLGFDVEKALQVVVSVLRYLKEKSSMILVPVTKVLADGSRYESCRPAFGGTGILDFYLDLLAESTNEHDWTSDALRLVGNTCADLDDNRERALAKLRLAVLLGRLTEEGKGDVAIGVLLNLCLDYEPAQVALRANHLFPSIIQLLEYQLYKVEFLPQVSLLLDIAIKDCWAVNPELYPDTQAIAVIYQVISAPGVDFETQASFANAIVALLKYEQIQKTLIENDQSIIVLDLFVLSCTQDAETLRLEYGSTSEPMSQHQFQDTEDEAHLAALRSGLSASLWDMTALSEFTVKFLPESNFVQRLISWLSTDRVQMQVCACSTLRNVASSDQNATDLVMRYKVHQLLIPLLESSNSLQVLEASIRLMKNLAVPAENKKELGAFECVTLLWSKFDSPTLHYAAASLVRQLLRGCFINVYAFLQPTDLDENVSYASRFLSLYNNNSNNDQAIKTEVARTVVEIWRTANGGDGKGVRPRLLDIEKALREQNLRPDEMVKPVVAMILTSENPSLVTEGWFGLALMADSEDWIEAICNALHEDAFKNAFRAAVSNRDEDSKDRDNARILAGRLSKHSRARLTVPPDSKPLGFLWLEAITTLR